MRWALVFAICGWLVGFGFAQPTTLPAGAWAEMIQDRKFVSAVTYEAMGSPWKPIGIPGMVSMDREFPYVGEHAVAIQIPGSGAETGILQGGLKVQKGMKYTGRIVVAADEGVLPVVVQLALHDGQVLTQRFEQVRQDYATYPLEFTAPISSDDVRLEIISNAGPGILRIGAVSLMPADQVLGFRADIVERMKAVKRATYRWSPKSGDWRKGLGGDCDRRSPESDDLGLHEFLDLMELIGAEAVVVIGKDDPALREYLTGDSTTPMGKLRAENGREKAWTRVRLGE